MGGENYFPVPSPAPQSRPTLRPKSFQELVAEAEGQPFSGWDFSYLKGRYEEGGPSWDYRQKVIIRMKEVRTMLDMGTGGGELLSTLRPLPKKTFATETYPPNAELARRRLRPIGVRVVQIESEAHLPFDAGYFDLVINRHEDFSAKEVHRILKGGGTFITQQVGGKNNDELNQLLQEKIHGRITHPNPSWNLARVTAELKEVGFDIVDQLEESYPSKFYDIGAVVYFLRHVPWEMPDFDTVKYRGPLLELHQKFTETGRLRVTSQRFYVEARKDRN